MFDVGRAGVKNGLCRNGPALANESDVPPLSSALRLSRQPLIGGTIASLQARSSTRQEAQPAIVDEDAGRAYTSPRVRSFLRTIDNLIAPSHTRSSDLHRHVTVLPRPIRSQTPHPNPARSPPHIPAHRVAAEASPRPRRPLTFRGHTSLARWRLLK